MAEVFAISMTPYIKAWKKAGQENSPSERPVSGRNDLGEQRQSVHIWVGTGPVVWVYDGGPDLSTIVSSHTLIRPRHIQHAQCYIKCTFKNIQISV